MPLKRKRDPIFTTSERDALITLVGQHFEVLESKKTDAQSIIKKNEEWKKVSHEFKAISTVYPRHWVVLKNCWENLKKRARQKQTLRNQNFLKTGREPPRARNEDPTVERVLQLIYNGVTSFHNTDEQDGIHALSSDSNSLLETTQPEVFYLNDDSRSMSDDQVQGKVEDDEPIATTSTSDWSQYNMTIPGDPLNPIVVRSPSPPAPNSLRGQAAPLAVVRGSGVPASSSLNHRRLPMRQETTNTRRIDFQLKSSLRAVEKHEVEMNIKKEILKQEQIKTKQEQIRLEMLEIQLKKLKKEIE